MAQSKGCLRLNRYASGVMPLIFAATGGFWTGCRENDFTGARYVVFDACCGVVLACNVVVAVDGTFPFPPDELPKNIHAPPRITAAPIAPAIILLSIFLFISYMGSVPSYAQCISPRAPL